MTFTVTLHWYRGKPTPEGTITFPATTIPCAKAIANTYVIFLRDSEGFPAAEMIIEGPNTRLMFSQDGRGKWLNGERRAIP